jgi:hypothetical protein
VRTPLVRDRGCGEEELERIKLHSLRRYGRPAAEVAAELEARYRSGTGTPRVTRTVYEEPEDRGFA